MKFHRIVITLFTLCTASLLSMKQIKLIHDAMKHEKGLDLIGHAIEISQNHTPYHTDTQPHVYFVQHLKKYGKTLYPELMRKKLEYGGITAAHLVYPCPDTFMRTIAPLLHETDSGEILIVEHQDKQIQEHLEQQDYEGLALELPEVFLGIHVYQKRNMPLEKMYCAGEAILQFYNFNSVEHVMTRNPALFKAIVHEQHSTPNRIISSPIRDAYTEAEDWAENARRDYVIYGKGNDGGKDIYTCKKEHVDDYVNERLWDKRESPYTIHRGNCSNHQHHILCKMKEDPRRFITFRHNAQTLKENIWLHNCRTDQMIIEDWGGIDVHSVIEPNSEAYNFLIGVDDFLLHRPVKNNKALIENAQLCLSTHEDGLCYNPERDTMIKKQYEKDEQDYAIIRKKAPRLLDPNILNDNYVIGYEEANLLEECGFYGIQGLHERNS